MSLFQAKRDCNPGGAYYRQGQIADFATPPDAELFSPVKGEAEADVVTSTPDPAGKPMSEADKLGIMATSKSRRAERKEEFKAGHKAE